MHGPGTIVADATMEAMRWWMYLAAGALAFVVVLVLGVFLTPAWRKIREILGGRKADPDVVNLQGLLEEGGRPISALAHVRKAVMDMAEGSRSDTREIVDYLIAQAWNLGASDVHFTPGSRGMTVQLRVDGILYDLATFPQDVYSSVLIRLKILSRLDPYKRDRPQDGRILVEVDRPIDIRISTLPTIHGEKAVLRFLTRAGRFLGLEDLGFREAMLERYEKIIMRPQGMVLVTGPTGSGKTTTLYASLEKITRLRGANLNIVTIEDPVERELPFLNQTQVNEEVGLTFASGLRSVLRQDPNAIMVGEIRDQETADIAMHAGLTGHMIFSTVHAESSPGVFARLLNMGVEPFICASATSAIMGQRLVRKLCPHCREQVEPSQIVIEQLGRLGIELGPDDGPFWQGKGCVRCFELGVMGRTGLFELLVVDDVIREELVKEVSTQRLQQLARDRGMVPVVEDGLEKAREGLVSLEEVLTVVST